MECLVNAIPCDMRVSCVASLARDYLAHEGVCTFTSTTIRESIAHEIDNIRMLAQMSHETRTEGAISTKRDTPERHA